MTKVEEIHALLAQCTPEERLQVFRALRKEFNIHPLEEKLHTKAEVILEAFGRANDLTLRGIRGIIAEAAFSIDVVGSLAGWKDVTQMGDHPYDCLLEDNAGRIKVQVKMQRLRDHRPMRAKEGYRFLPDDMFVVETQRTRGGLDNKGEKTRPYRFGEFDILAVALHPSTSNWSDFVYTVADWLIPDPKQRHLLLKFQPVSAAENEDWTTDFLKCVGWLRSHQKKQICAEKVKLPAALPAASEEE
jgi:hypothetical protein